MPEIEVVIAPYLRQPCDAGLYGKAVAISRQPSGYPLMQFRPFRPWPDNGHLTFYNIDELRQLVDTCAPQDVSHECYTRVVGVGEFRAAMIFGIGDHSPELDNIKLPAPLTQTPLPEKWVPG